MTENTITMDIYREELDLFPPSDESLKVLKRFFNSEPEYPPLEAVDIDERGSTVRIFAITDINADDYQGVMRDIDAMRMKHVSMALPEDKRAIVYFDPDESNVAKALTAAGWVSRLLGVMPPPLNVGESADLAKALGASDEQVDQVRKTLVDKAEEIFAGEDYGKVVEALHEARPRTMRALTAEEQNLVLLHIPMASMVAMEFKDRGANAGHDLDDLVQQARIGLMRAAQKFDETRGTKFSTLAYTAMRNEIKSYLADQSRWGRWQRRMGEIPTGQVRQAAVRAGRVSDSPSGFERGDY